MVVKLRVSLSGVVCGSLTGNPCGALLSANREVIEPVRTRVRTAWNREATDEKLAVTDLVHAEPCGYEASGLQTQL